MNGKEPAFPCSLELPCINPSGLTKRELFAAMAMQGMLAQVDDNSNPTTWDGNPSNMARIAVTCADALLAELDKPQDPTP